MGIVGKIGDVFHKIEYHTSDAPEIKGQRFEDHVENLFSQHYFRIIEKTHSFKTNSDRYIESSKNPDFIFEYVPTKEQFAVECKFRTRLNRQNQLEWSYPAQLKRYQEFAYERKMPVYIVVGLELTLIDENDPDYDKIESYMFNIPLEAAKYPALFESVFAKYERDYNKPFFWKKGILY